MEDTAKMSETKPVVFSHKLKRAIISIYQKMYANEVIDEKSVYIFCFYRYTRSYYI